jgi:hypothetical protein
MELRDRKLEEAEGSSKPAHFIKCYWGVKIIVNVTYHRRPVSTPPGLVLL